MVLTMATDGSGKLSVDFKVKYGPIPFTIVEEYSPMAGQPGGLFYKTAKMPGGDLLRLATVVVDADEVNGTYTLFSCIAPLGAVAVTELVVASRARTMDDAAIADQLALAHSLGVPFEDGSVKRVTAC